MQIKTEVFSADEFFNKLGECDFEIQYNEHQTCRCHFHIIAAASTTIRELSKNGIHPSKIALHSPNQLNYLTEVIRFFYGNKLKINSNNVAEFVQIGHMLKSQMLLAEAVPVYIFFQRKENIQNELNYFNTTNKIKLSSIQFLAFFFQWLISDKTFISQINESILCQIISHPQFKIESEDYLIERLIEAKVSSIVFRYVRYDLVTAKGYKKIFKYFNSNDDIINEILKRQFCFSEKSDPTNNPRFVSPDSLRDLIYEYTSPQFVKSIPPD